LTDSANIRKKQTQSGRLGVVTRKLLKKMVESKKTYVSKGNHKHLKKVL